MYKKLINEGKPMAFNEMSDNQRRVLQIQRNFMWPLWKLITRVGHTAGR